VMATAAKSVMATDSNTMGNCYHCPLSSAAAAAVEKDDKGRGSLFLYGVVLKKNGLCVSSISMIGKEAVCPDGLFLRAIFRETGIYFNSLKWFLCKLHKAVIFFPIEPTKNVVCLRSTFAPSF
jgi:hypothetical protein